MSSDAPIQRMHVVVPFIELLERLGFDTKQVHITRTWNENDGLDYLHLMIEPGYVDGHWVEPVEVRAALQP